MRLLVRDNGTGIRRLAAEGAGINWLFFGEQQRVADKRYVRDVC